MNTIGLTLVATIYAHVHDTTLHSSFKNAEFHMLNSDLDGKGLQAVFQGLKIDVLARRQGTDLPKRQSRHCPTCCIGHQLSF